MSLDAVALMKVAEQGVLIYPLKMRWLGDCAEVLLVPPAQVVVMAKACCESLVGGSQEFDLHFCPLLP